MHKRSAIVIIVLVIAFIAFLVALITRHVRLQSPIVFLNEPQQVVNDNPGNATALSTSLPSIAPSSEQSRTDVLRAYDGKVMSFDDLCQAYPKSFTVPKRTVIVFNNRSNEERNVSVESRTYTIDPQDFALAAMNEAGEFSIRCDGQSSHGIVTVTS